MFISVVVYFWTRCRTNTVLQGEFPKWNHRRHSCWHWNVYENIKTATGVQLCDGLIHVDNTILLVLLPVNHRKKPLSTNVRFIQINSKLNFFFFEFRYAWSKEKFLIAQLQEGMRRQAMYQGTDLEREIRAEFEKDGVDMKDA